MHWSHYLIWIAVALVFFYIGKHYPNTFAGIPGVNQIL